MIHEVYDSLIKEVYFIICKVIIKNYRDKLNICTQKNSLQNEKSIVNY